MTKAYTLNLLINEIAALRPSQVTSLTYLAAAISPVARLNSRKIEVLDDFLNGNLVDIIRGNTAVAGKTGRARVLNALRARKAGNLSF